VRDDLPVSRVPEGIMGRDLEPRSAWPKKVTSATAAGPEICAHCGGPVQVRKVGRGGLGRKRFCLENKVWEAKCPGGPKKPAPTHMETLPARRDVAVVHADDPVPLDLAEAMRRIDHVKVQTSGPQEFLRRLEHAASRWERILGLPPLEE